MGRSCFVANVLLLLMIICIVHRGDALAPPAIHGQRVKAATAAYNSRLWSSSSSTSFEKKESSSSSSTTTPSSKSLMQAINRLGQSFKPKAVAAHAKSVEALEQQSTDSSSSNGLAVQVLSTSEKKKLQRNRWWYLGQSTLWYGLYIIYRSYRGFFVLLPAVFRQVYDALRDVVPDPFADGDADVNSVSWRARITVGILAGAVTLSYVGLGALRVGLQGLQTLLATGGSLPGSLAAAADQHSRNERLIAEQFQINNNNNNAETDNETNDDIPVNGEDRSKASP